LFPSARVAVPRYFFDTYDGALFVPNEVGLELADIEAAKLEAERALPEMAWDELPDGNQRTFIVSVRDEAG
jgi:hypothetical protein